jgi:hypothetical protein
MWPRSPNSPSLTSAQALARDGQRGIAAGGVGEAKGQGDERVVGGEATDVGRQACCVAHGTVAGGAGVFGDDEGDGVADMADGAIGQDGVGWQDALGAVAVIELHQAGEVADLVGLEVGAGVDGADARGGFRRFGVDAGDAGRGVRAAEDDAVEGAGGGDIVGIGAIAFQQAGILDTADGLGNAELGHGGFSPDSWPLGGGSFVYSMYGCEAKGPGGDAEEVWCDIGTFRAWLGVVSPGRIF